MTNTHTEPTTPPHGSTAPSTTENWQRWWSGLTEQPGEVLWEAHPDDLANDLTLFGAAFTSDLPVVDFGCGDGHQTRLLGAHFPAVVGIDVAPAAIARARAHSNPSNVFYRVVDARRPDAARKLHDELGDVNVYIRGVLQALPPADRPRAVQAIATMLGRTGTLFVKELAPGVERYFAALTEQHGPAPGMTRIMELVPPGTVSDDELARLFTRERFDVLAAGRGHIHTVNATPDGHPIMVPAVYAIIAPRAPRTPDPPRRQRLNGRPEASDASSLRTPAPTPLEHGPPTSSGRPAASTPLG